MRLTYRDQREIYRLFLKEDLGLGPNEVQKTQDVTSIGGQNPMPTKSPGQGMNPEEEETPNSELVKLLHDVYIALVEQHENVEEDARLQRLIDRVKAAHAKLKGSAEDEQSVYSNPPNGTDGHTLTPFVSKD